MSSIYQTISIFICLFMFGCSSARITTTQIDGTICTASYYDIRLPFMDKSRDLAVDACNASATSSSEADNALVEVLLKAAKGILVK